jgi:P-type conjugative transfer ATPase TrbB
MNLDSHVSTQEEIGRRYEEMLRRALGPDLLAAIEDPAVMDILVNDDGQMWVDKHGSGIEQAGYIPNSQIETIIGIAAAALNEVANVRSPIVEGELPIKRIRFEGLLPPIARGPCFAMRKAAQVLYTLDDCVIQEIVTADQAATLRSAISTRQNIVIGGPTGSGKTTFAGAIINEMVELAHPAERFVIIEDTLEIQCRAKNLVQLHTSEFADMTRLVRATMRLRPDRIIVGEVRGAEALSLLKAWSTGHPGGVTTIHANSARGIMTRLGSLVQEAKVPPQTALIAETIHMLAFLTRINGARKLAELVLAAPL